MRRPFRFFWFFCLGFCLFLLCTQGWNNNPVIKIEIIEDEVLTNKEPALLAANKSNLTFFPLAAELVEYDLEQKTKRKLLFEKTKFFNLIDMQYISNQKIGILTIDSMYIGSFDNAHFWKKTIESIRSFACLPTGKKIFFGTRHGQIGYFEFEKDEIIFFPVRHQECVWSVCLFPCGKKMATGSSDGIIQIWSLEKKEILMKIKTSLAVNNICIDPEGKLMAVGFDCGHIGFWSLDTLKKN